MSDNNKLSYLLSLITNPKKNNTESVYSSNTWEELYNLLKQDLPKDLRFEPGPTLNAFFNAYQTLLARDDEESKRAMRALCRVACILLSSRFESLFCPSVVRITEFTEKLLDCTVANLGVVTAWGTEYSRYALSLLKASLSALELRLVQLNTPRKTFQTIMDKFFSNLLYIRGAIINYHPDSASKPIPPSAMVAPSATKFILSLPHAQPLPLASFSVDALVAAIDSLLDATIYHTDCVELLIRDVESLVKPLVLASADSAETSALMQSNPRELYLRVSEACPAMFRSWHAWAARKLVEEEGEASVNAIMQYPTALFLTLHKLTAANAPSLASEAARAAETETPTDSSVRVLAKKAGACPREFALQYLSVALQRIVARLREIRCVDNTDKLLSSQREHTVEHLVRRKRAALLQALDEFTCFVVLDRIASSVDAPHMPAAKDKKAPKDKKKKADAVEPEATTPAAGPWLTASMQAHAQLLLAVHAGRIYAPNADTNLSLFTFLAASADAVLAALGAVPLPTAAAATGRQPVLALLLAKLPQPPSTGTVQALAPLTEWLPTLFASDDAIAQADAIHFICRFWSRLLFLSPELVSARIHALWVVLAWAHSHLSCLAPAPDSAASVAHACASLHALLAQLVDTFARLRQLQPLLASYVAAASTITHVDTASNASAALSLPPLLSACPTLATDLRALTPTALLALWDSLNGFVVVLTETVASTLMCVRDTLLQARKKQLGTTVMVKELSSSVMKEVLTLLELPRHHYHTQRQLAQLYRAMLEAVTINVELNNEPFVERIAATGSLLNSAIDTALVAHKLRAGLISDDASAQVELGSDVHAFLHDSTITARMRTLEDVVLLANATNAVAAPSKSKKKGVTAVSRPLVLAPLVLSAVLDIALALDQFALHVATHHSGAPALALALQVPRLAVTAQEAVASASACCGRMLRHSETSLLTSACAALFLQCPLPGLLQALLPVLTERIFAQLDADAPLAAAADALAQEGESVHLWRSLVRLALQRTGALYTQYPHLTRVAARTPFSLDLAAHDALEPALACELTAVSTMLASLVHCTIGRVIATSSNNTDVHAFVLSADPEALPASFASLALWVGAATLDYVPALHAIAQASSRAMYLSATGLAETDAPATGNSQFDYACLLRFSHTVWRAPSLAKLQERCLASFVALATLPASDHVGGTDLTFSVLSARLTTLPSFFEIAHMDLAMATALQGVIASTAAALSSLAEAAPSTSSRKRKSATTQPGTDDAYSALATTLTAPAATVAELDAALTHVDTLHSAAKTSAEDVSADAYTRANAALSRLLDRLTRVLGFPHPILAPALAHACPNIPLAFLLIALDAMLARPAAYSATAELAGRCRAALSALLAKLTAPTDTTLSTTSPRELPFAILPHLVPQADAVTGLLACWTEVVDVAPQLLSFWVQHAGGTNNAATVALWLHTALTRAESLRTGYAQMMAAVVDTFVETVSLSELAHAHATGVAHSTADFAAALAPALNAVQSKHNVPSAVVLAARAVAAVLVLLTQPAALPRAAALLRVLASSFAAPVLLAAGNASRNLFTLIHVCLTTDAITRAPESPAALCLLWAALKLSHNTRALAHWAVDDVSGTAALMAQRVGVAWRVHDRVGVFTMSLADAAPSESEGHSVDNNTMSLAMDVVAQHTLAPMVGTDSVLTIAPQSNDSLTTNDVALLQYMPVAVRTVAALLGLLTKWVLAKGPHHWMCTRVRSVLIGALTHALTTTTTIPIEAGVAVGGNVCLHWLLWLTTSLSKGGERAMTLVSMLEESDVLPVRLSSLCVNQSPVEEAEAMVRFTTATRPAIAHAVSMAATVTLSELSLLVLYRQLPFTKTAIAPTQHPALAALLAPLLNTGSLMVFFTALPTILAAFAGAAQKATAHLTSFSTAALVQHCLLRAPTSLTANGGVAAIMTVLRSISTDADGSVAALNSPHSSLVHTVDTLLVSPWAVLAPPRPAQQHQALLTGISCALVDAPMLHAVLDGVAAILLHATSQALPFASCFAVLQPLLELFFSHSTVDYPHAATMLSHASRVNAVHTSYVTGSWDTDGRRVSAVGRGVNTLTSAVSLQKATFASGTSVSTSMAATLPVFAVGSILYVDFCSTLRSALRLHASVLHRAHMPIVTKAVRALLRFLIHGIASERALSLVPADDMVYAFARMLQQVTTAPMGKEGARGQHKEKNKLRHISGYIMHIVSDLVTLTKMAQSPLQQAHWRVLRAGVYSMLHSLDDSQVRTVQTAQDDAGRHAFMMLLKESNRVRTTI